MKLQEKLVNKKINYWLSMSHHGRPSCQFPVRSYFPTPPRSIYVSVMYPETNWPRRIMKSRD